jgi:hypothetical protein
MPPLASLALALPGLLATPLPAGPAPPGPAPCAPAPGLPGPGRPDHGKLDWFEGSFEALLAEAKRTQRLVFIDFWADW